MRTTPQTPPSAKKKILVEMSRAEYDTLKNSAQHNERSMSGHIRFLIRRELVAR